MAGARKDKKGRALREGEHYRQVDGRYMYTYLDARKRRRFIYATDLMKLREREDELKRDQLDGIDNYVRGHVTVNEAFDRYITVKSNLRVTTKTNYEIMYNAHVRKGFGEKLIGDVKFSDVKQFYQRLVEEDKIKPNTVRTIHCCLYPTFQMAVRDDIIRKNPCHDAYNEMSAEVGKNKGVRNALTIPQQKAFMEFIDGHPIFDHWHPVFTVLLGTGCRCGEFIGLRWQDIDMEKRMISINHGIVRAKKSRYNKRERMTVSRPKTEAGIRTIPMLDQVYEAFDRVYKEQCETGFNETVIDGMSGFIFKNELGNVLSEQNINAAIRRITEAYNMKEEVDAARQKREPLLLPHFSCHYLRHTFCTRFCENENNLKVIQSVMGHKSIKTTMEVYAECTNEKKIEAMQNLSAKWKDF